MTLGGAHYLYMSISVEKALGTFLVNSLFPHRLFLQLRLLFKPELSSVLDSEVLGALVQDHCNVLYPLPRSFFIEGAVIYIWTSTLVNALIGST